jgi:hypothetical protein
MTDYSPESEPARDVRLGLMLRETIGGTPSGDVDWAALAKRIGDRLPVQMSTPWWTYASRWERRAIPLALAAGIMGAIALWGTAGKTGTAGTANVSTTEEVALSAVASGELSETAARQFSQAITSLDIVAGMPE